MSHPCKCGCGQEVKSDAPYKRGHHLRDQAAVKPSRPRNPTLNDPTRERTSSEREARRSQIASEVERGVAQRLGPMELVKREAA